MLDVDIIVVRLVGVFVGFNFGGEVFSCYSIGSVNFNGVNSFLIVYVGGLIGLNVGNLVENSYFICSVDVGSK